IRITPYPSSNTLLYDFGDGDTTTATGTVYHTYPSGGSYTITINSPDGFCTQKVLYASVTAPCNANFTFEWVAPFTMKFKRTDLSTHPNSKWFFGDGDSATGDSAIHTYAGAGYYYPYLAVHASSWNQICSQHSYFLLNSC